ncbi:MAG: transcriptional regulator, partial [Acidobacteriota bacterium]
GDELAVVCSGDVARVRWRGRELLAPAGKGFDYLAALIAAPRREVHVSELVGDDDRGDAGEVLDARAREQYRERARELEQELEDARSRNDLGRAERLGGELEAISDQLLAATGLGGRARRAGSRVERARVNVQRRIKDAIRRLAAEDAALGRYLDATIKTGVFCAYVPV